MTSVRCPGCHATVRVDADTIVPHHMPGVRETNARLPGSDEQFQVEFQIECGWSRAMVRRAAKEVTK